MSGYKNLAGRVGSGQEVFEMSRDGSGRVGTGRNWSDRVGLGDFQIARVETGCPDST